MMYFSNLFLQSFPSCSVHFSFPLRNLPKLCSSWFNDQSRAENSNNLDITTHLPEQSISGTTRRHQRKMPFRRKNWCGCIQVSIHFFNSIKINCDISCLGIYRLWNTSVAYILHEYLLLYNNTMHWEARCLWLIS